MRDGKAPNRLAGGCFRPLSHVSIEDSKRCGEGVRGPTRVSGPPGPPRSGGPGNGKELCLVTPPSAGGHQEEGHSTEGEQGSPKAIHTCSLLSSAGSCPEVVGRLPRAL